MAAQILWTSFVTKDYFIALKSLTLLLLLLVTWVLFNQRHFIFKKRYTDRFFFIVKLLLFSVIRSEWIGNGDYWFLILLTSVAMDGNNRNRLKLEKNWPVVLSSETMSWIFESSKVYYVFLSLKCIWYLPLSFVGAVLCVNKGIIAKEWFQHSFDLNTANCHNSAPLNPKRCDKINIPISSPPPSSTQATMLTHIMGLLKMMSIHKFVHPLSRNCRENKPLFVAGPFDQAFNISKKLDIKEVGPYLCIAVILS